MTCKILTPREEWAKIKSVPNARNDEAVKSERRAQDLPLNEGEGGIKPTASSIPTCRSFLEYELFLLSRRIL
jgi:hypothetical protein